MMRIHPIQTGTVAITTSWREGVGHGKRRLLNTVLDRECGPADRPDPSRLESRFERFLRAAA
jgi:hypothetical protein